MSKPPVKTIFGILDTPTPPFPVGGVTLVSGDWLLTNDDLMLCHRNGGQAETIDGWYNCWSNNNKCRTCEAPVDESMRHCSNCGASTYERVWEDEWQKLESWRDKRIACIAMSHNPNSQCDQGYYFQALGPWDELLGMEALRRREAKFERFQSELNQPAPRRLGFDVQNATPGEMYEDLVSSSNIRCSELAQWALISLLKEAFDQGFQQGIWFQKDKGND